MFHDTTEAEADSAVDLDVKVAFNDLARKTLFLRRKIRSTKFRYIRRRFGDESVVQDFEQSGFRISGMPPTHPATASSIGHAEVIMPTLHQAFSDLARVAVFLDQARVGEANERFLSKLHFTRLRIIQNTEFTIYFAP